MIKRVVKMTYKPEMAESFLAIYQQNWEKIKSFPGCQHVELLRDRQNPAVFFTYSWWNSDEDLNAYRDSELFAMVWGSVKPMFAERAMAWSVDPVNFPTNK